MSDSIELPPALRVCARDRLRDEIVRRILTGVYSAGTHLKEMVLAHEFGVSQAPVREALRELEVLGLVASERYCGTHVLPCGSADVREAYALKALIEERAAQLAVPCAADDLAVLAAAVADMRAAVTTRDVEAYAVASLTFHRRIVMMSGNRQFLRSWESMRWEVRSRIAIRRYRASLTEDVDGNEAVLAALTAGDGVTAGRVLRERMEKFVESETQKEGGIAVAALQ